MQTARTGKSRWPHWLRVAAGVGVTLGLATALIPTALAQTKTSEKAAPVAKESRVVDVLVGTGGIHAQVNAINEMLAKSWKENKIVHAERCNDYEFIRRASLDIIGRIAK